MTSKEIIYIAVISAIGVYAIFLTVMLIVMNNKSKKANILLKEQMTKNYEEIVDTKNKMEQHIKDVDTKIEKEKENNDKRIGELFENTMTATSMLVDEKTKNLTEKLDDINLKLNIMESSVRSIEREKTMVHSLLTTGKEPIETEYSDIPKDGFMNNARKAGSNFMKAIKRIFPK